MTELVCITCPLGCHLNVETGGAESLIVTGNRCARGLAYAREEFLSPRRTVTTTCRITHATAAPEGAAAAPSSADAAPRRIPVRTSAAFPKERIPELIDFLRDFGAALPVRRGQPLARDLLGTGIDLVATRDLPSAWSER